MLTPSELVNNPNPPILTVGARAVQKHAQRSTDSFWGPAGGISEK